MQDWAKDFYTSNAWRKCREAYKKSKRNLCEKCLKRGIIRRGEILHHIIPITRDNINDLSVTLDFKNLQLLCRKCHGEEHGVFAPTIEGFEFDEKGDYVPTPPGIPQN